MSERNVLIVEDDPDWARLQRTRGDKLKDVIIDIEGTEEGAMRRLGQGNYQVVATDIHLTDGDYGKKQGYEIAREAKKRGVPFVIISSNTDTPSQTVSDVEFVDKSILIKKIGDIFGL